MVAMMAESAGNVQAPQQHGEDCACASCDASRTFNALLRDDVAVAKPKLRLMKWKQSQAKVAASAPGWNSDTTPILGEEAAEPLPAARTRGGRATGQRALQPAASRRGSDLGPGWNSDFTSSSVLDTEQADGYQEQLPTRQRRPGPRPQRTGVAEKKHTDVGPGWNNDTEFEGIPNAQESPARRGPLLARRTPPPADNCHQSPPTPSRQAATSSRRPPPKPDSSTASRKPPSRGSTAQTSQAGGRRTPTERAYPQQPAVADDPGGLLAADASHSKSGVAAQRDCPHCNRAFSGRSFVLHVKQCGSRSNQRKPSSAATAQEPTRQQADDIPLAASRQRDHAVPAEANGYAPSAASSQPRRRLPQDSAAPKAPAGRSAPPRQQQPAPRSPHSVPATPQAEALEQPIRPMQQDPIAIAAAAAAAGASGMPEEDAPPEPLEPCQSCGRSFRLKALERHMKICNKVFCEKRKVFDATAQAVPQEAVKAKKVHERQLRKDPAAAAKEAAKQKGEGALPKWKKESEALRDGMKQARLATQYIKGGRSLSELPPPKATKPELDDRKPCPHCGRRFGDQQAERHIPFCAKQKAKKKGR
eukprot:TRINITY_DN39475_c0_g1_i1.p1 TRINITY_DN39475_c0_g1~~TRINITY_DN39475_c0_g1_i1.p1  ORF type:complete len:589 (+),score=142.56 TRINITY_DN39475_c0_g1_i1:60-1826(+)